MHRHLRKARPEHRPRQGWRLRLPQSPRFTQFTVGHAERPQRRKYGKSE
ncbi:hypothetical protein ACFPN7_35285 [Amycolatopsis halotolerans]